jgi:hypothetical protein
LMYGIQVWYTGARSPVASYVVVNTINTAGYIGFCHIDLEEQIQCSIVPIVCINTNLIVVDVSAVSWVNVIVFLSTSA